MSYSMQEYQRYVETLGSPQSKVDRRSRLLVAGLGIAGEAGEVADTIKKTIFHGLPENRDNLLDEAGDVMWYIAWLANYLNVSIEDICQRNAMKLMERYPNGFDPQATIDKEAAKP